MLTIIETPHRGPVREWTAKDKEDFVQKLLASNLDSGSLDPDMTYEAAVEWLRSDLRSLDIRQDYPAGLTGESAYYACEGPRDQAIAELQQIRAAALRHDSEECRALAEEARVYLAWLADHDSCADMPEDWEPEVAA